MPGPRPQRTRERRAGLSWKQRRGRCGRGRTSCQRTPRSSRQSSSGRACPPRWLLGQGRDQGSCPQQGGSEGCTPLHVRVGSALLVGRALLRRTLPALRPAPSSNFVPVAKAGFDASAKGTVLRMPTTWQPLEAERRTPLGGRVNVRVGRVVGLVRLAVPGVGRDGLPLILLVRGVGVVGGLDYVYGAGLAGGPGHDGGPVLEGSVRRRAAGRLGRCCCLRGVCWCGCQCCRRAEHIIGPSCAED